MKGIFENPNYEDLAGMEEYDMLSEELDEELYEEYIDEFDERPEFFQ